MYVASFLIPKYDDFWWCIWFPWNQTEVRKHNRDRAASTIYAVVWLFFCQNALELWSSYNAAGATWNIYSLSCHSNRMQQQLFHRIQLGIYFPIAGLGWNMRKVCLEISSAMPSDCVLVSKTFSSHQQVYQHMRICSITHAISDNLKSFASTAESRSPALLCLILYHIWKPVSN